ncbi:MAG: signal peptide peptidase SppA [Candidatus Aenigmatarchaeota archaeon]
MEKGKIIVVLLVLVGILTAALAAFAPVERLRGTEVAVIPVRGTIGPQSMEASPEVIQDRIGEARKEGAEGFLFQINSPGGTVVASSQLEKVISDVEEFTVCQFQDYATSGAYWASSACDRIVADPLTMTGGIGVTSSYLEYSELMEEYGVEYVRLAEGDLKDMGSPYRNLTEKEREIFQNMLDGVHSKFIETVAENRNITDENIKGMSRGQIILGEEAKEYGLVDQLGGRKEAKEIFKNLLNEDVTLNEYRETVGLIDILLGAEGEMETAQEKVIKATEADFPKLYALAG